MLQVATHHLQITIILLNTNHDCKHNNCKLRDKQSKDYFFIKTVGGVND